MLGYADTDPEEEKAEQKALAEQYKPLLDWLKNEAKDIVRDGERMHIRDHLRPEIDV